MKKKIMGAGAICMMTIIMGLGITAVSCWAAQNIVVSNIQPAYVEKGEMNYTVTMRADVKNNGPSETVAFNVVGVDKQGYQHQIVTFSGNVPVGKTRALMKMITLPKATYEQIDKWVLMKK